MTSAGDAPQDLPWLEPSCAQALADAVSSLGSRGAAALVCGAGTELPLGNLPRRADARLSTTRLVGIDVLDADEGVARVAAGTPVATLREAANAAGLEVPLDPPSTRSTIGGALAAAAIGPRTLGFGRVRDQVLGLDVVLGSGELTRCGGRVVKNVSGYDMAKLYVGSHGTICVIAHAWLRLRPLPERVCVVIAPLAPGAFDAGLAAARLPGARAAALVDASLATELDVGVPEPARDGLLLVVELASDAEVVAQGVATLAALHGARENGSIEAVGAIEGSADDPRLAGVLRIRVTARPSKLAAAYAPLHAAGARVVVYPGLGLLCARFEIACEDDADRIGAALGAAHSAASAGDGHAVLAAGPRFVREGRDAFLGPPPALALLRRVASQLDPKDVLNPGIFVGGI